MKKKPLTEIKMQTNLEHLNAFAEIKTVERKEYYLVKGEECHFQNMKKYFLFDNSNQLICTVRILPHLMTIQEENLFWGRKGEERYMDC